MSLIKLTVNHMDCISKGFVTILKGYHTNVSIKKIDIIGHLMYAATPIKLVSNLNKADLQLST